MNTETSYNVVTTNTLQEVFIMREADRTDIYTAPMGNSASGRTERKPLIEKSAAFVTYFPQISIWLQGLSPSSVMRRVRTS